jgi:hypothetical protein
LLQALDLRIPKAPICAEWVAAPLAGVSIPKFASALAARRELRVRGIRAAAAMAEVLRIISSSPTELQPVLDVVVKSAARFCGADDVTIFELDGQHLYTAAHYGPIPQGVGDRPRVCVEVLEAAPFSSGSPSM